MEVAGHEDHVPTTTYLENGEEFDFLDREVVCVYTQRANDKEFSEEVKSGGKKRSSSQQQQQ